MKGRQEEGSVPRLQGRTTLVYYMCAATGTIHALDTPLMLPLQTPSASFLTVILPLRVRRGAALGAMRICGGTAF